MRISLPRRRGRPRDPKSGASHLARPAFHHWTPIHVTLKVQPGLYCLRGCKMFRAIHRALCCHNLREDFRLVHYSVQRNHLHLIVESQSTQSLTRAVQGLSIRLARCINRASHRAGRVFADRYRSRSITNARDARNTLRYVLNNARRHAPAARRNQTRWKDPCSSAPWFRQWSTPRPVPEFAPDRRHELLLTLGNAAVPPKTRLLASGWLRAGPIELMHVPGPVEDRAPHAAQPAA